MCKAMRDFAVNQEGEWHRQRFRAGGRDVCDTDNTFLPAHWLCTHKNTSIWVFWGWFLTDCRGLEAADQHGELLAVMPGWVCKAAGMLRAQM